MNKAVQTIGIILAVASRVAAQDTRVQYTSNQTVRDYVEIEGARSNHLTGYGIVTGLNGNGDNLPEAQRVLRNIAQNLTSADSLIQDIKAKNAALVIVNAELPPFQKEGTKIDIQVSAVGDAKTLFGGTLQVTPLYGPGGRQINVPPIALAQGKLVVQGDQRTGNVTNAIVPNGAIIETPLMHVFVKDDFTYNAVVKDAKGNVVGERKERTKGIKLLLRKPDVSIASELAKAINQDIVEAGGGKDARRYEQRVAISLDGGSILVRIPSKEEWDSDIAGKEKFAYPGYTSEPVKWLDKVLSVRFTAPSSRRALVVINDATKTVAISGDVIVTPGAVSLNVQGQATQDRVNIPREMPLQQLLDELKWLKGQALIDAIKAMYDMKLIKGEVVSR